MGTSPSGAVDGRLGLVSASRPAFATDQGTAVYYEQRAAEYDDWYEGCGPFAALERPGWSEEVAQIVALVSGLRSARTLDVACGTGFLTRHLRGLVIALDQSPSMVAITQSRLPAGVAIVGDALSLPFADGTFERVFTGHFYGHLPGDERATFLSEVHRVARELVVVDTARRDDRPEEQWETRALRDGSYHPVYKRYLTAGQLAHEIDGRPLHDGRWFVAAHAATQRSPG